MSTTLLILNPARKAALLQSVSTSIDMLNDLALDPMWHSPASLRELATKSDDEIRATINTNANEVNANIDQLLSLQLLYTELSAE